MYFTLRTKINKNARVIGNVTFIRVFGVTKSDENVILLI